MLRQLVHNKIRRLEEIYIAKAKLEAVNQPGKGGVKVAGFGARDCTDNYTSRPCICVNLLACSDPRRMSSEQAIINAFHGDKTWLAGDKPRHCLRQPAQRLGGGHDPCMMHPSRRAKPCAHM